MDYISLRLGGSGLKRQGWVIGADPLKSVSLGKHPIYKGDPLKSVSLGKHPIYKGDPLKSVSLGKHPGCMNTFQCWRVM